MWGNSTLRCEDFEFFKFTCVWALCCAVVCVQTLRFSKFPVCGTSDVVCEDFEFSEFPCVCVCGLSTFTCEDFDFFLSSHVCGLYTMACDDFEFSKSPCVWTLCCDVWRLGVFKVPLCTGFVCFGM